MKKMLLAMGIISLLAGTTGALAACKGAKKDDGTVVTPGEGTELEADAPTKEVVKEAPTKEVGEETPTKEVVKEATK